MKRVSAPLPVLAVLLLSLSLGCATKVYMNAETGTSGDLQAVLSKSIEEAFASVPEEVWSHRISLEVSPSQGEGLRLSAYVRQYLIETISHHEGSLEPPHELYLRVIVPAAGNLITERRLSLGLNAAGAAIVRIPLFYGETSKGVTQTIICYRDKEGKLSRLRKGETGMTSHEIYWFWVLGPFKSEAFPQF